MNYCTKYVHNNDDNNGPIDFCNIFSEEENTLDAAISRIENRWELKYANGRMRK